MTKALIVAAITDAQTNGQKIFDYPDPVNKGQKKQAEPFTIVLTNQVFDRIISVDTTSDSIIVITAYVQVRSIAMQSKITCGYDEIKSIVMHQLHPNG